jgi:hypothetical protein
LLSSALDLSEDVREILVSILTNKLFKISTASLVYPLLLEGLEAELEVLSHESEAGPFVEEIKLFVVLI